MAMKKAEHTLSVAKLVEKQQQIKVAILQIKQEQTNITEKKIDPIIQDAVEVVSALILKPTLENTKKEKLAEILSTRAGLSLMDKQAEKTLMPEINKQGIIIFENKPRDSSPELSKDISPINAPKFVGGTCRVILFQYGNLLAVALRTDHGNYFGQASNILEKVEETMDKMKEIAQSSKGLTEQQMLTRLNEKEQQKTMGNPLDDVAPSPNWPPKLERN